jgi:hypothetical protein
MSTRRKAAAAARVEVLRLEVQAAEVSIHGLCTPVAQLHVAMHVVAWELMARDLTVREVHGLSRLGQHRVSRNLYVQVTPTGTKSWLFRYMNRSANPGMRDGGLMLAR